MEKMNDALGLLALSEPLRIAAASVVTDDGSDVPLTVLYGDWATSLRDSSAHCRRRRRFRSVMLSRRK